MRPIIEDLKKKEPDQFPPNWRVGLLSFKETFPSSIRENLWILFGAVGLLLLIACANVSNLLLSKASARQKEMAVRAAMGASRTRLVRQLLTESLMLAVIGAVVGVALAYAGLQVILTLVPPNTIPDESEITLNLPVLLFTLVVSALTSIVFGLAPALHACSRDLVNPLREAGRGLSGSARQAFLRRSLVVAEVALSLMLLIAASLMIRTFLAVQNVDPGFRTDRLLTMRIPLPEQRYPDRQRRIAFFQEVLRRVQRRPWRDGRRVEHRDASVWKLADCRSRSPASRTRTRNRSWSIRSIPTTRRRLGSRWWAAVSSPRQRWTAGNRWPS